MNNKNKIIMGSLIFICIMLLLCLIVTFTKKVNPELNSTNPNYNLTFNGYKKEQCQKDKNKKYKSICEKDLGNFKYSEKSDVKVKVKRTISKDDKEENYIYLNEKEVEIPKDYTLDSLKALKYKNQIYNSYIFFISVKKDDDYNTFLIDPYGRVKKSLTTNYHSYYVDLEVLSDGNAYILYNTCNKNKLEFRKVNLDSLDSDYLISSEDVLTCK